MKDKPMLSVTVVNESPPCTPIRHESSHRSVCDTTTDTIMRLAPPSHSIALRSILACPRKRFPSFVPFSRRRGDIYMFGGELLGHHSCEFINMRALWSIIAEVSKPDVVQVLCCVCTRSCVNTYTIF